MSESNVFALTFVSNTGERILITIPRAKKSLTATAAQTGMSNIIASSIVTTAYGRPVLAQGAELVTTTISDMV